jgi:tetratricopeptide (TPR) repeat protein
MRLILSIAMAVTALGAASPQEREFAEGKRYYQEGEFGKAAARFRAACESDANVEACYWTGLSYERLADTRIPFGCRTDAKAREYFRKAVALAPERRAYRDGFFEFLLNTADCSRAGLREAAALLAESDPEYDGMRSRLEDARRQNGSTEERLGRLFLMVPRATVQVAALPVGIVGRSGGVANVGHGEYGAALSVAAGLGRERIRE